jgi:hypothetical protein
VGTGLGILVRARDFTLVYDGGSNDDLALGAGNRMLAYINAVAPTLRTIDGLILSHPHRDHVELLPDLFTAYKVREVWDSGRVNDICGYRPFIEAIRDDPGVKYHNALQDFGTRGNSFGAHTCYGQAVAAETVELPLDSRITTTPITLGQGAAMTILHGDGSPFPNVNDNSLVVRLDLVVGSARRGRKILCIQVRAELSGEDTCEPYQGTSERRGFPAPAVVMKRDTICVAGEELEPDDGFLRDIDVEKAPVGAHGDVVMAAIGQDGGGEFVRVVDEHGSAPDRTFGRGHRDSYAGRASGSSAWSG